MLTETCDGDGAGYSLYRRKKIEQKGGKLDKHLEERLKEDLSKKHDEAIKSTSTAAAICVCPLEDTGGV